MVKNRFFHIFAIPLAFLATCVVIAYGSYFRAGLNVTVGEPAGVLARVPEGRYVTDFEATEINRLEALRLAQGLPLRNTVNLETWSVVENNLNMLRDDLISIRNAHMQERETYEAELYEWEEMIRNHEYDMTQAMMQWQTQRSQAIAAGANPADLPPAPELPLPPGIQPEWNGVALEEFERIAMPIMPFSDFDRQFIADMTDEDFALMWNAVETVAEFVQTLIIISEIDTGTQFSVESKLRSLDDIAREAEDIISNIVINRLLPNSIPDTVLNELEFERQANDYVRVTLQAGDIIVTENAIVTENIYNMLLSLDMMRTESLRDNFVPMLGVFIIVAALFLACIMYLYFYRSSIIVNVKESMLLLTLYVLTLSLVWALSEFNLPVFPLLIFSMLMAVLIERRAAAMITFCMVFICYFIVGGSLTFLIFYSTSGVLICLLSKYTTERSKVFLVGMLISAIQFALSIAISLVVDRHHALDDPFALLTGAAFAALSGLLTVIICTGSLPLWETFFGVVTPVKMLDLTNPTNPLLRRLTIEAPGTYHHSLIVANLAEAAAYDIGANAHAARVGGYYHDVGKLKFPHYFAENLDGDNPHDHIDPINSAQLIMSHVSYGLTLSSEHRLPQFVRDIIKEHHGTTLLQFFYSKAKERDAQVDDKDYRYPYTIPQTRESACVMLADSVEAAARAMIPKLNSVDEVEKTIRNIIRGKLNDGQLADSQLSIKDVTVIEQSFFRVLKGMYHERIAYPKAKVAEEA